MTQREAKREEKMGRGMIGMVRQRGERNKGGNGKRVEGRAEGKREGGNSVDMENIKWLAT